MLDNPYRSAESIGVSNDVGGADANLYGAVNMLSQTKPWVRFISVVMFIGSAFMILAGVVMMAAPMAAGGAFSVWTIIFGVVYIAMAVFYIMPAVFLWRYADRIAMFVQEGTAGSLASALESQKSFWKFVGILTMVIMAVYAVAIVFTIVATIGF
jgi:hypothetical protein